MRLHLDLGRRDLRILRDRNARMQRRRSASSKIAMPIDDRSPEQKFRHAQRSLGWSDFEQRVGGRRPILHRDWRTFAAF